MVSTVGRTAVFLLALILLGVWTGPVPGCSMFERAISGWMSAVLRLREPVEQQGDTQASAAVEFTRLNGLRWGGEGPSGLHISVDTSSRRLQVLLGMQAIMSEPVGVGKAQTPTPLGTWSITSKGVWGGAFGARWNGISIPWGRYGIHGTNRPGSIGGHVSAGCVRMFNQDVIHLYELAPVGTVVSITGSTYGRFGETVRVIRYGYRGRDVMYLQRILAAENLYHGSIDGIFGGGSRRALRSFQEKYGWEVTGEVSEAMWQTLGLDDESPRSMSPLQDP